LFNPVGLDGKPNVPAPELRQEDERLTGDAERHLRAPELPLAEHDRHLDDLNPARTVRSVSSTWKA
jgi:hypothetical protein